MVVWIYKSYFSKGGKAYHVNYTIPHEKFIDVFPWYYDIALIKLKKSLANEPIAKVIDIAPADGNYYNKKALVMGFGYTSHNNEQTNRKFNVIAVKIFSAHKCKAQFSIKEKIQVCVSRGTCRDDSGGPLVVRGEVSGVSKSLLVGLVSSGSCNLTAPEIILEFLFY